MRACRGLIGFIVALSGLAGAPPEARSQDGACSGESGPCRYITAAEDKTLRALLAALERQLPVPDSAAWERDSDSDGMSEKERQLEASRRLPWGAMVGSQLFVACVPYRSLKGSCFTDQRLELRVRYNRRGTEAAAQARVERARTSTDPAARLLAVGEALAQTRNSPLAMSIHVLALPAEKGCGSGPDGPKIVEKHSDFLYELYSGERGATARMVFGERSCDGSEDEGAHPVTERTPLAPVRSIILEIRGPTAEVSTLVGRIDRKAFAARLGPIR